MKQNQNERNEHTKIIYINSKNVTNCYLRANESVTAVTVGFFPGNESTTEKEIHTQTIQLLNATEIIDHQIGAMATKPAVHS